MNHTSGYFPNRQLSIFFWWWQYDICGSFKMFQESFISENYKTVQSFKLHCLQNSPLVQQYTSASDCKDAGNIPGSHFVKSFAALLLHSQWCMQHHTSAIPSMLISVDGTDKNELQSCQESTGHAPGTVTLFFAKKFLTKTDWCAGALSWRRNQMLVPHILGCFLLNASLRRRKVSMYISLFTIRNAVNYTSKFL